AARPGRKQRQHDSATTAQPKVGGRWVGPIVFHVAEPRLSSRGRIRRGHIDRQGHQAVRGTLERLDQLEANAPHREWEGNCVVVRARRLGSLLSLRWNWKAEESGDFGRICF